MERIRAAVGRRPYGFWLSPAGGKLFTSDSLSVSTRPSGLTSWICSDVTRILCGAHAEVRTGIDRKLR